MADLTITAANVIADNDAVLADGIAGAGITAGKALYLEAATNKWKLADCDAATAEARVATAIALNGASDGQPVKVMKSGTVTIGAALSAGVAYYLSATAGGICPVGDLTTGKYPQIVGMAISTTKLKVNFQASGVAL